MRPPTGAGAAERGLHTVGCRWVQRKGLLTRDKPEAIMRREVTRPKRADSGGLCEVHLEQPNRDGENSGSQAPGEGRGGE